MILLLIAASLASHSDATPRRVARPRPAPCQAVPALCQANGTRMDREEQRLGPSAALASDGKMSAYRFDARPCRIVGNMNCPKRANRQIFRLGEPVAQTLARSFGLD